MKNKKGIVYTCFTAGYDELLQHTYTDDGYDYICFTDDIKLIIAGCKGRWKIRPLVFDRLDNPYNIRWHKILPHRLFPEYKISIWVDANIDVLTPQLFAYVDERALRMPLHHARACVYDECMRVLCGISFIVVNLLKKTIFILPIFHAIPMYILIKLLY